MRLSGILQPGDLDIFDVIDGRQPSHFTEHRCQMRTISVRAGGRLVLWAVDAEDAWRGGLRADGQLSGGKNGKICGKEMNAVRQRLRLFGRTTGARTRSAADYSMTATLSVVPDPLNPKITNGMEKP